MARHPRQTRRRILEIAYELFYRQGFVRTNLDQVAAKAGVTKRTFYYHFDSKDAVLAAALELRHELALARIHRWSTKLSGDPRGLIDHLFMDLAKWAAQPRWQGAGFTRMVWELGDLPGHPARAVAKRHKLAIEDWLADQLPARKGTDARETARQILLLLEGCQSLMLISGDRRYAETAARAAKQLLSGSTPGLVAPMEPRKI